MEGNKKSKVGIITELSNSDLNQNTKEVLLDKYVNEGSGESSMFDKVFGKVHPEIFVAFSICVILAIIGIVCTLVFNKNIEFVKYMWGILIPAISLGLGYIFGKGR